MHDIVKAGRQNFGDLAILLLLNIQIYLEQTQSRSYTCQQQLLLVSLEMEISIGVGLGQIKESMQVFSNIDRLLSKHEKVTAIFLSPIMIISCYLRPSSFSSIHRMIIYTPFK